MRSQRFLAFSNYLTKIASVKAVGLFGAGVLAGGIPMYFKGKRSKAQYRNNLRAMLVRDQELSSKLDILSVAEKLKRTRVNKTIPIDV